MEIVIVIVIVTVIVIVIVIVISQQAVSSQDPSGKFRVDEYKFYLVWGRVLFIYISLSIFIYKTIYIYIYMTCI